MQEQEISINLEDAVNFDETSNQLEVNTRFIAKAFDKEHKNVLRSVRKVTDYIEALEGEISGCSFEPRDYKDSRGQVQSMYVLNQDAFLALVMDFTGDKAYHIKFKILKEFSRVRKELAKLKRKVKALEDEGHILVVESEGRIYIEKTKLEEPENRVKGIQKLNPARVVFQVALHSGNLKYDFDSLQENLEGYKGEFSWYDMTADEFNSVVEATINR